MSKYLLHVLSLIALLALTSCASSSGEKIAPVDSYQLNSGESVPLPIQYKNWHWMMAAYSVPVEEVKKMLPEKLIPVPWTPGKAMIAIGVLEYPDVYPLQPYDEWLVAIPVRYDSTVNLPFLPLVKHPLFESSLYPDGGAYIVHLPVTTAESHRAGSEIWGFPKVHRDIKCREERTMKRCELLDKGEMVMSLSVEKIKLSKKSKDFKFCSFTEKEGDLLRTCVKAKGSYDYKVFGKGSLTLGRGGIAKKLSGLNVDYDEPLQVFRAEISESQLPMAGERFRK